MASFYRKWRPQTFNDLVGQDHIKQILANAIKSKKAAHAYLFSGPKGTGKTSAARLLAKSLNCEKVNYKQKDKTDEYEPCNKCAACTEISSGNSMDVIEIDAASNRGIEEIRELRERIKFSPARLPFKIFIIDEVHMLTREAFNALLKTLEEPPKHAIFILATTEIHKVLPTIISRCQRFDFKKGQLSQIKEKLNQVVRDETLEVDAQALNLLAINSEGSFRDAVSLLDQVASVSKKGKKIEVEDVKSVLGLVDDESVKNYLIHISRGDVQGIVEVIQRVLDSGGDPIHFANQLLAEVRRLLLLKSGVERSLIASDWSDSEVTAWAGISSKFSTEELMELVRLLSEVGTEIKRSVLSQLPLEIVAITWMQKFSKTGQKDITIVLEEQIKLPKELKVSDISKPEPETSNLNVDSVSGTEEKKLITEKEDGESTWNLAVEKIKPINHALYTFLKDSYVRAFEDERLVLGVRTRFHSERIVERKNKLAIEEVLQDVCGKPIRLECLIDEKLPKPNYVVEQDILTSAVEVFGMEE